MWHRCRVPIAGLCRGDGRGGGRILGTAQTLGLRQGGDLCVGVGVVDLRLGGSFFHSWFRGGPAQSICFVHADPPRFPSSDWCGRPLSPRPLLDPPRRSLPRFYSFWAFPSSSPLPLSPTPFACPLPRSCVLGFAYPGYKTFKVLKGGDVLAQREWLKYWCVLGLAAVLSLLTDLLVGSFLPGYGLLKLGAVVALVSPTIRGYSRVWAVVEPHLAAQEGAIDGAVARAMDATAAARSTGAARANAAIAQGRVAAVRQAEGVKKRATAGRGGGGAAPKSRTAM